ncbi:hypothetical protein FF011L_10650 [Roseimaritima multifibrata]|uniref:Uncharacterized protein n=1 Tax=Roseimaritima multifibrata TaxID=1930274 RepID=A0A517MBR8_9BACT|nr:hypothetical protein FF011L_10650 [Roseimaritima multifibrata]
MGPSEHVARRDVRFISDDFRSAALVCFRRACPGRYNNWQLPECLPPLDPSPPAPNRLGDSGLAENRISIAQERRCQLQARRGEPGNGTLLIKFQILASC